MYVNEINKRMIFKKKEKYESYRNSKKKSYLIPFSPWYNFRRTRYAV